jgi:hypothetical protein
MSAVSTSPLLLTCLERFERQAHKLEIRDDVVVSFCKEVIPLLSENPAIVTLRDSWQSHRAFFNHQVQETDAQALLKTKEAFLEIKKSVNSPNEAIKEKLILFTPDYELVNKIDIKELTFAPTVIKTYSQIDEIRWKQYQDPAIIWWYFDCALWCRKTPESYFDQIMTSKQVEDYGKYFYTLSDKVACQEIACVRDNKALGRTPVVFTKEFFQKGLTTLINSINIFLSNGANTYSPSFFKPKQPNIIFELILDRNELWIKAIFENQETEQFYIQKFYDSSDHEGSPLYKFVKNILKSPEPGQKKAKLLYKWETASKHINRLQLPDILKEAFFGRAHGSTFDFKGITVELPDDSIDVLRQLRERHLKMPNKLRKKER